MRRSHSLRLVLSSLSLGLFVLVPGCDPVREDRTISFSHDGKSVAFQHDREGVYIAKADGSGLTKIFQPDEKVLATSRPLASPTDGRYLFATAEALQGGSADENRIPRQIPADGRSMGRVPVRYTVWLRSEELPDHPAVVTELFKATCNHVGYIGAGLAVRWHPSGKRIMYLADVAAGESVFEYDIDSSKTRQVFPHTNDAVIFDWTPSGTNLVCLTGQELKKGIPPGVASGIWIGNPEDSRSWWRVEGSEHLARSDLLSTIESLRASFPAWTRDESQFAYVTQTVGTPDVPSQEQLLQCVDAASRNATLVTKAIGRITDLHWSPDGKRLGFIERRAASLPDLLGILSSRSSAVFQALTTPSDRREVLRIWERGKALTTWPTESPVNRFAGFDSTGKRMAFITSAPLERPRQSHWALLLVPDLTAHDSVWVAETGDWTGSTAKEVQSGMRVTFPLWSPTEERLSLWGTFTPRYVSLLTLLGIRGVQPGDPAATFDVRSGKLSWMAVSPQEELQIGHYSLLKKNPEEAWSWYSRARAKLPPSKGPQNWEDFMRQLEGPENSLLFEAICLDKLGRSVEAAARRAEFEKNFFPADTSSATTDGSATPFLFSALIQTFPDLGKRMLHDLYVAEVYLSVDAPELAITYFSQPTESPETDASRLSRSLVLSQLQLITGDHDGYASQCGETIAPLAAGLWKSSKARTDARETTPPADNSKRMLSVLENGLLEVVIGAAMAPLMHPQFVGDLSEPVLRKSTASWKKLRDGLPDDSPAVAADLILRTAYRKLGNQAEVQAAEARLSRNPATVRIGDVDKIESGIIDLFKILHAEK